MSRLAAIPLLLALAWAAPAGAQQAPLWRLVAQSDVIATGRLNFPTGTIPPRSYVLLPVSDLRVIKGVSAEPLAIRWFSEPGLYAPSAEQLATASASSSVLFALRAEGAYYFAGNSPDAVQPADSTTVASAETEIARQAEILRNWRADPTVERYAEVRSIIDRIATLRPASDRAAQQDVISGQQALFDQLIALGDEAVPAIIMQMDDQRPLAASQISLVNKFPGAFEGIRHYGPDLIVDALEAVLNDITGESFGGIYNGGSSEERAKAVRGWRIYLDHRRSHPAN
jgi:hypothetical protein